MTAQCFVLAIKMNNSLYHKDVLLESAVSCSLSIVGGTVILASYYILPEIRNFTRKLVVCLTVADLLTAMGYLVSAGRFLVSSNVSADGNICKIQSTITTYSSLVSFFLTSIIAIYIFDTVQMKKDRLGSSQWLVFFNALSWGVPGKYDLETHQQILNFVWTPNL